MVSFHGFVVVRFLLLVIIIKKTLSISWMWYWCSLPWLFLVEYQFTLHNFELNLGEEVKHKHTKKSSGFILCGRLLPHPILKFTFNLFSHSSRYLGRKRAREIISNRTYISGHGNWTCNYVCWGTRIGESW